MIVFSELTAACYWPASHCIPAQTLSAVLMAFTTTVRSWCLTPTGVCAVTVESCKINRLLFADGLVLLAFLNRALYLVGFLLRAIQAEMKISTKKTEALCISRNLWQCTLQVNGNTLLQVEKFQCLRGWVIFTTDGKWNREIDTRVCGEKHSIAWALLLATKREISNVHESWVMTERMLSKVQAAEIGSLRRVHGVTSGVFMGRRPTHLPRAPLIRDLFEVLRA